MGQGSSGGGSAKVQIGKITKLTDLGSKKLVVEDVEVIRKRIEVKIPEVIMEEVRTIKYVPHEEPTTKYVVEEKPTTRYIADEQTTTEFKVRQEETIKYIAKDVECEKPILVDKPYERPVITNKEYQLVTFTDMEAIRDLMSIAPKLLKQLEALKAYKLVEEIVTVPKIEYETRKEERIVWVDAGRCKKCGGLVSGD